MKSLVRFWSYLGSNTFDPANAGMLLPYPSLAAIIPEPSALGLLLMTTLGFALRKKNSAQSNA